MPAALDQERPAPWVLRGILYRRPVNPSEWVLAVVGATVLYSLAVIPVTALVWMFAVTR